MKVMMSNFFTLLLDMTRSLVRMKLKPQVIQGLQKKVEHLHSMERCYDILASIIRCEEFFSTSVGRIGDVEQIGRRARI
jgi:hypothetical protein